MGSLSVDEADNEIVDPNNLSKKSTKNLSI